MENSINNSNNFTSSVDNDQEHVMHWESDSVEIMINDEADEVRKDLFDSLKNRYQNNLEPMSLSSVMFICYIINVIK